MKDLLMKSVRRGVGPPEGTGEPPKKIDKVDEKLEDEKLSAKKRAKLEKKLLDSASSKR